MAFFKKDIISKIFLLTALLLFFLLQFHFFSARTQSFAFADENEHLTPGWMMATFSKNLYEDLTTNHQPIPIIVATVLFFVADPPNLTMTIERTRQLMIALSFAGALFLTVRFGWRGLLASIVVELSKFYLFGYHLLAESLVVYPIMYLGGLLALQKFHKYDSLFVGLSLFLLTFNLLPLWPFVVIYLLVYLNLAPRSKNSFQALALSFLIPTFLLFIFINPSAWFQQTVTNNINYFLPHDSNLSLKDILIIPVFPFTALWHLSELLPRQYLLLLLLFIIGFKSRPKLALVIYLLLILLNNRVGTIAVSFYGAFHLLPQLAFLTMVALLGKINKLALAAFILLLTINASSWWHETVNFANERYVNYSSTESVGLAIASIAGPTDTLLAGPQGGYINLTAKIPLSTTQNAYLPWAYRVPEIAKQIDNLAKNPPSFVYFPEGDNPIFLKLKPMLSKYYYRIKRFDGQITDLYILKRKAITVSEGEWQNFSVHLYEPPFSN